MPEKLGFEQRAGNRRAIDGDEWGSGSRTGLGQRTRDELLAGSALTDDHRRRVRRPYPRNQLTQRTQRLGMAQQSPVTFGALELAPKPQELPTGVLALDRPVENRPQTPEIDRLLKKVEGAGLHDFDRLRHPGPSAHDHESSVVTFRQTLGQEVLPIVSRHVEVRNHHLGSMSPKQRESGRPVRGFQNAKTPALQCLGERPPTRRFVVDQKHFAR